MTNRPSRRTVPLALLTVAALGGPIVAGPVSAQANRDLAAEQFVQTKAQSIISVLANRRLSAAQKNASFHQAIDELADVPRITSFVLGKYARTITPAQQQQFAAAFRIYAENVYQSRLDEYHGEGLKVTGSVVRKPGDVVVNSVISGGQLNQPLPVAWRVISTGGGWKVVDVQLKGVWLAITQQQDFVSTIDNARGDISVLITRLQRDTQRPAGRKQ